MLTCKPGDMAIVVRGEPEINLGRVVRVLELSQNPIDIFFGYALWTYEGELSMGDGTRAEAVADNCLRPLRDTDGQDETLTWRDVPTGVPA